MSESLGFMGGLGVPELLVILLIAVLVFGAGRIPEIARSLGKSLTEFKKGRREGQRASEADEPEKKKE